MKTVDQNACVLLIALLDGPVMAFGGTITDVNAASKAQTFAERLAEVKAETETFLKELDELSKMELNRCTVGRALAMRDTTLRSLVNKYVTTVSLMDGVAE